MKVLFSCAVGFGPFHSQVPLARAFAGAGHEVAFATGPSFCSWVARVGFPAYPAGMEARAVLEETARRYPYWPAEVPTERLLRFYLTRTAASVAAPAVLVDLLAIVRHWRPDVIVHDPGEFAAPIAAAWGGIPSVNHGWGPLLPTEDYHLAAEVLAPLWQRCRLSPRPLAGMYEHLYLDVCPPSIQSPDLIGIEVVHQLRPVPVHLRLSNHPERVDPLPSWADELADRPTVYATLGTVFSNAPGLLAAVLGGVAGDDVNVVMAIGNEGDDSLLGRQTPTVRVERFVPQSLFLPRCDAVVCHGGAGTILAALDAGLPLLLLPVGIDQFHNSRRCAEAGVGRWLGPEDRSPARIGEELRVLLDDARYRGQAARAQQEIESMPGPERAVLRIEQLV